LKDSIGKYESLVELLNLLHYESTEMSNKIARNNTILWIQSALNRFENMYHAGLDLNGKAAIDKAIDHLHEKGKLTVGQVQYLFNRSHPKGHLSTYNTHRGYNKRYGDILVPNLKDLIDSDYVDWATGKNSVMQPALAQAIFDETDYEWRIGNIHKKPPVLANLFEVAK
jgi:hypothetical protein